MQILHSEPTAGECVSHCPRAIQRSCPHTCTEELQSWTHHSGTMNCSHTAVNSSRPTPSFLPSFFSSSGALAPSFNRLLIDGSALCLATGSAYRGFSTPSPRLHTNLLGLQPFHLLTSPSPNQPAPFEPGFTFDLPECRSLLSDLEEMCWIWNRKALQHSELLKPDKEAKYFSGPKPETGVP